MGKGYLSQLCCLLALPLVLASCKEVKQEVEEAEDLVAKQMLQGIWVDDETDMPFMKIVGDSIYYSDSENLTASFFIKRDSFYVVGADTIPYAIDLQTEARFRFHQFADNIIALYHSETEEDSLYFIDKQEPLPIVTERIEKDSVVMYNGKRYRGYVFVNPSKMRVIKTSIGSSGMLVDNVYYDNIIHICVYTGATELYGRDITKQLFADYIPADFLNSSILADMDFMGVDGEGYHYDALVGDPESSISAAYQLNLTITPEKELRIQLAQ